ncbi:MAG: sodium/solute symporter [Bacteroidales bacterium]|nr:sodium/solute symporter [Bacteroidales bacterium]
MTLSEIDYLVIGIYLVLIIGIGLLIGFTRKSKSTDGFFLAGRTLRWPMIGMALFAANISTIHLIGLAGQGFSDGLIWGNFEWMAPFLLIVLAMIFVPFYIKTKISTLPEFLEIRYNKKTRSMLAVISLFTALFMHIGVSLYAGALVFETFFGIERYTAIFLIAIATLIYSVVGGLKAVVVTETIQSIILIGGATILTIIAIFALPENGIHTISQFKEAVKPGQLDMIQGAGSPLPWWTVLLGYPVLGLNYWCADQTIVQKVLAARSIKDAQYGSIFAGFIKILPVFIMVVPGVIAYVLFSDQIKNSDNALPFLILKLLPTGLKGLMSAALLAALMSTIASALNSAGTLVTMDIIKQIRPSSKDRSLLMIGRITIISVIIIAVAWSPLIAKFPSIFEAINDLLAVFSPPISVVFLWGILSKRGTPNAGFYTLLSGFIIGLIAFALDFEPISGARLITDVLGIHFMMKAFILFVICSAIYFSISYITECTDKNILSMTTMSKPWSFITDTKIEKFTDPRIMAGILLLLMITMYYIFH